MKSPLEGNNWAFIDLLRYCNSYRRQGLGNMHENVSVILFAVLPHSSAKTQRINVFLILLLGVVAKAYGRRRSEKGPFQCQYML
jgi:hypothetical protein